MPTADTAGRAGARGARGVTWGRALREAVRPRSLRRSMIAAGVVGTTLMIANLGARLTGEAFTIGLGLKVFVTYAVPWGNATVGIAMGLRERGSAQAASDAGHCSGVEGG